LFAPVERASPAVIGLHHVAVVVANVSAAADFYRKVFELPDRKRLTAAVSSHGGAWFQLGALELHLQERKGETPKTDQHFALLTDRFDEICRRVREYGGRVEEAKLIEGISQRCFLFDLDQNKIELLQK
jgi:catechol 2,3-dioxygenase-like lactoylglutathione lyase family enzyme